MPPKPARPEVMVINRSLATSSVVASIEAGATGYLLQDSLALDLPEQLRSLRAGGSPISPVIARRLLQRLTPPVQSAPQPPTPWPARRRAARPRRRGGGPVEQESRVLHLASGLHLRRNRAVHAGLAAHGDDLREARLPQAACALQGRGRSTKPADSAGYWGLKPASSRRRPNAAHLGHERHV